MWDGTVFRKYNLPEILRVRGRLGGDRTVSGRGSSLGRGQSGFQDHQFSALVKVTLSPERLR